MKPVRIIGKLPNDPKGIHIMREALCRIGLYNYMPSSGKPIWVVINPEDGDFHFSSLSGDYYKGSRYQVYYLDMSDWL